MRILNWLCKWNKQSCSASVVNNVVVNLKMNKRMRRSCCKVEKMEHSNIDCSFERDSERRNTKSHFDTHFVAAKCKAIARRNLSGSSGLAVTFVADIIEMNTVAADLMNLDQKNTKASCWLLARHLVVTVVIDRCHLIVADWSKVTGCWFAKKFGDSLEMKNTIVVVVGLGSHKVSSHRMICSFKPKQL